MIRGLRFAISMLFALALLVMPIPIADATQEATPEAECVTTTPEENEALVTAYWEEAVWGNQGKIAEIVASNEVHHWGIGGDTTSFDAFQERWALFLNAFPDLRFDVDLVAAEGDLAATIWTATGTQTGEWQDIPPTGKEVSWSGINIFRIECGMIAESWGEADHIGLRAQLGATDVPSVVATPTAAGAALAAPEATPCPDDSPQANAAIARRWTEEAATGGNLDVIDEIADPAIVHHGGAFPDVQGSDAVKKILGGLRQTFPDLNLSVDITVAGGNIVAVRWSGTGTQEGEFLGVAPSGKVIDITGINVYRMACGRIIESWSESNVLDQIRQMQGTEAAPAATPAE